jgi:pyruvate formate lyase activating enzyme
MKHPAMFYKQKNHDSLECFLCSHRCVIKNNAYGLCGQRQNIGNRLYTYAYADVVAANVDPIEKKPLSMFLPNTKTFSIAVAGCNFRCSFCQNWQISQPSDSRRIAIKRIMPEDIVRAAIDSGCNSISYTYTEPTVFFEYSYDIARLAKKKGLSNIYVTNGYITREALEAIGPYLDAANIDLKSFNDSFYRDICKARLEFVLETIKNMRSLGIWIEITTLLVTGLNDSADELKRMAKFILGISKDTPWHISRFYPNYRMQDIKATPLETMHRAERIARDAGLRHVYLGNV